MQKALTGIVLSVVKLADKKIICKLYTREHGLRSYLSTVSHSAKSKIKPAHLLALNQVEIIVSERENRDLGRMSEMRCTKLYLQLHLDVKKMSIAVFISELLNKCLRESESNPELFDYITQAMSSLDSETGNVNDFHLEFLLQLSKYLGFFPNNNYSEEEKIFDLMNGIFVATVPSHPHFLKGEEALSFSELIKASESQEIIKSYGTGQRRNALHTLINYYKLHVPGFGELKTIPVLRDTLS